ncbi:MAG: DNA mismatch repair endonuclease MutL [Methanomicrobiales archaeon]|nr:DNA mismatch repair endonuclease MutL [Methanomicrobiales archaeon]
MVNPIKILDSETVNQIAAGEVIERPASIVKELVENSIDAQARYITISVTTNKDYITSITVTDDGTGISDEDLPLAFTTHATSKINSASDISSCTSLGFRGEALASIASIAYVTLTTCHEQSESGRRVVISGGEFLESTPIGAAKGTSVCVEQIFFNAPVRRKFLKSRTTELAWMYDTVEAFCLHFPHLFFRYMVNQQERISTHGRTSLREVMQTLGFDDTMLPLLDEESSFPALSFSGYISKWDRTYQAAHKIFLSVNGRRIVSTPLISAIREGYADLIGKKEFPSAVIHITIDPGEIDPNVHPAKREIRFADETAVRKRLTSVVSSSLVFSSVFADKSLPVVQEPLMELSVASERNEPGSIHEKGEDVHEPPLYPSSSSPSLFVAEAAQPIYTPRLQKQAGYRLRQTKLTQTVFEPEDATVSPILHPDIFELIYVGQIDCTFLIAQVPLENGGMVLIDQHAAHERIRYDQIMMQRKQGIGSQELLEPVILSLTPLAHAKLLDFLPLFHEMGFMLEPFGRDSVRISGVPVTCGHIEKPSVVQEIVCAALDYQDYERAADAVVKQMACHHSIRANMPLTCERGTELLQQLAQTHEPRTCPHGRPVMVHFSMEKLAGLFKRT